MNKKIIIFGCSEFSNMIRSYIEEAGEEVVAFCEDKEFINDKIEFFNLPVISFDNIVQLYPPDEYEFCIALGYRSMNDIRKERFCKVKEKGYRIYTYIHPTAIISTNSLGEGNIILENVVVGKGVSIGTANIFQIATVIAHHTIIGSYNFFAPCCSVAGEVLIKDNCFFGINCTIKNGICIDAYTLCGAGCIITKSTSKNSVIVPANSITLEKNSMDINLLS